MEAEAESLESRGQVVMRELPLVIDGIGEELTACTDSCAGIWRDQTQGIVPRTLYLQRPDSIGRGCLAVGLNPGRSKAEERTFYQQTEVTYDRVKEYRRLTGRIPYFTRTIEVIDQLGLSGPILWSNLAKCENADGKKELPPVQTMRHCTGRFLHRELEVSPSGWAVLAIGRDAFHALSYLVPQRSVIGIPHVTGAFPAYWRMFGQDRRLRKEIADIAFAALASAEPGAVWLGGEKQRG
jgi:hypothetical protein